MDGEPTGRDLSRRAPARSWEIWGDEGRVQKTDRMWATWRVARNRRKLVQRLAAIQRQDPELRTLLDFGCGTCAYFPLVRELGLEYSGVDRTPEMLARARQKFPGLELGEDDLLSSTTPDRSFDIVMCNDVLVHMPDPLPGLRTLDRIARRYVLLKLCLTTKRLPDWLERFFPPRPTLLRRREDQGISHFYNLAELRLLIETELDPRSVRVDTHLPITPRSSWPGALPSWEAIVTIQKRASSEVRGKGTRQDLQPFPSTIEDPRPLHRRPRSVP